MSFLIGVDVGTFESKGVLTLEDGTVLGIATHKHDLIVPQSGWAEHSAEETWWKEVSHIVKQLLRETEVNAKDVKAICTSAIGPCMLPLDSEGRPLMNGVLYGVDTRAHEEIDLLEKQYGTDYLLERCNSGLTSQSVGPKILWLKRQRPELYEKTRMILSATSYIVYRLTGQYVMDHFTAAGYTPLYDPISQTWNIEHCKGIIDPTHLPKLVWSTEVVGHVSAEAARETGLSEKTAVLCGTIDAAAEAVSVGVAKPGDMMMMYGSTIFIIEVTKDIVKDRRLWYAPWIAPGLHVSQAGLATSGTLTRWLGRELFRDAKPEEVIENMVAEGQTSPPGAKGLVVLPYFSGERTPIHDPKAKGMIFGLDLTHTRADIYRAAIEGIGLGVRHALTTFEEAGIAPECVAAVGGGTKNPLWLGSVSDASGYPQIVREQTLGASLGNAFMAAVAMGCAQMDDINKWNPIARIQEPNTELRSLYDKHFSIFTNLYKQTASLMADLS